MAITLSLPNAYYLGAQGRILEFNWTAAAGGDTLSVVINGGQPFMSWFFDANSNLIITSPPTFGAWSTSAGNSSATVTANAGGVVTNGKMVLFTQAS